MSKKRYLFTAVVVILCATSLCALFAGCGGKGDEDTLPETGGVDADVNAGGDDHAVGTDGYVDDYDDYALSFGLNADGKSCTVTGLVYGGGDVVIPDTYEGLPVTAIGNYAFYDEFINHSVTSVAIPDTVTMIGAFAFAYCRELREIKIPDSVITIGNEAFYYCYGATTLSIGKNVTKIGMGAFGSCSSLTSVAIPGSVTSIESSTFHHCTSLTSVTIGSGVTSIGYDAFYYCTSLTSVTIPDSVTSIGYDAFLGCSNLSDVYYPGTASDWDAIAIGSGNSFLTDATRHYT